MVIMANALLMTFVLGLASANLYYSVPEPAPFSNHAVHHPERGPSKERYHPGFGGHHPAPDPGYAAGPVHKHLPPPPPAPLHEFAPHARVQPVYRPSSHGLHGHHGLSAAFSGLSYDQVRTLTRFISSICRICKGKTRDRKVKYYHKDDEHEDEYDYHGYDDDHDYHDDGEDYSYLARSLLDEATDGGSDAGSIYEQNSTSSSEGNSTESMNLDQDRIPSVTRSKRSVAYHNSPWGALRQNHQWRTSSHASYYKPHYQPTYGFRGQVQDSYFRHNPFYLYSKLAYIEHKLSQKKSNKKGRKKVKGYGSKGHKNEHDDKKVDLSEYGVNLHKH